MGIMKSGQGESDVVRYPELLAALSKQLQMPKARVKTTIDSMVALAAQELKKGKLVQLGGLGRLRVKDVASKASPGTGELARPSKKVVLVAGKKFREIAEPK